MKEAATSSYMRAIVSGYTAHDFYTGAFGYAKCNMFLLRHGG